MTWSALAVLDDGGAMNRVLDASPSVLPAWGTSLGHVAILHSLFEGAVLDALGATTYTPSLLAGSGTTDLPAFAALVAARDHASGLVSAFAANGSYAVGVPNVLASILGDVDYASEASSNLSTKYEALKTQWDSTDSAHSALLAGTVTTYDARPLEAARRAAMIYAAATTRPIVELSAPETYSALAADPAVASLAEDPGPSEWGLFDLDAVGALDSIATAFEMAVLAAPDPFTTQVAITYPNPSHVAATGEPGLLWMHGQAASAAAVWSALAAGGPATLSIAPADIYSPSGGNAVLVCTQGAPVIRASGMQLEYYPSPPAALTTVNGEDLHATVTAPALQPFMTGGGLLETFTSSTLSALERTVARALRPLEPVGRGDHPRPDRRPGPRWRVALR